MAQNDSSVEKHAERATRNASPWIERLARAGYVAYGVVYVLVGILAVQAAFVGVGKAASQEGALRRSCSRRPGRFCSAWSPSAFWHTRRGVSSRGCWTQRTRAGARKGS